ILGLGERSVQYRRRARHLPNPSTERARFAPFRRFESAGLGHLFDEAAQEGHLLRGRWSTFGLRLRIDAQESHVVPPHANAILPSPLALPTEDAENSCRDAHRGSWHEPSEELGGDGIPIRAPPRGRVMNELAASSDSIPRSLTCNCRPYRQDCLSK